MISTYTILGGSFDPIHYGHLNIITKITLQFKLKKIIIIPTCSAKYKNITLTSIIHRLNMIKLAMFNKHIYQINLTEINNQFIYSIDTLTYLRDILGPKTPILFIIGEDNLINITKWNQWNKILFFCHLIICPREFYYSKNKNDNKLLQRWINQHYINNINYLTQQPCGYIYFTKINHLNISSTYIRNAYYTGKSCISLLPQRVDNYIKINNLYNSSNNIS
ncbi:MAG: nicotinate (nicotinamide) nucleotide adenylyltransferase [Buchnera aphidicola (Eriosoma harunire)]